MSDGRLRSTLATKSFCRCSPPPSARNCALGRIGKRAGVKNNYRAEHLFALQVAVALYDFYTQQLVACDAEIERQFANFKPVDDDLASLPPSDKSASHSKNGPRDDARSYLYRMTGVDLVAKSPTVPSGPSIDA
jgi:hypothetical protein